MTEEGRIVTTLVKFRATLLLAAVVALSACSQVTTGAAGIDGRINAFTKPHVLRMGDITELTSLNPMLAASAQVSWLSQLTMAYFFRCDSKNQPIPELALQVPTVANGGISADGLTYTFHLRPGVKWSDGTPFTSSDVVFTVNTIMNPNTNVTGRDGWDRIVKMDTPNATTIVFHLSRRYAPFATTTFASAGAGPSIVPKHLLEHSADINKDAYNSKPVGIGPFRYVSWVRGDRVVMERNPYYWKGAAKLDKIEYHIIPNRNTVVTLLQTGDLDLWPIAPRHYAPQLAGIAGYNLVEQPSYAYGHYDFNLTHPVVAEKVVRQALRLGMDRPLIIKKIYNNIGVVQDGFESAASPLFDASIKTTPYDPAKANAMLDADGWKRGPDGIRSKNGLRLEINFATNSGSPDTDSMIEVLRGMWKDIGADLELKEYSPALMFAQAKDGGIVYGGKWDAIIFAYFPPAFPDESSVYGCKFVPPNGQNEMHWCDARADAAMNAILGGTDPSKIKGYTDIIQERLADDVPTIIQNINVDIYPENKDLKNFHPNQVSLFDDMMQVDI